MIFNSIVFLIFILAFLPLYFALKGRNRMWLCLAASYLFYGWWDWRFLGLVLFTTTLDYSLGIVIRDTPDEAKKKKLVVLSVFMNLGFLGFFKYFNFFADSFRTMLLNFGMEPSWNTLHIILPIGISFYTFQSMSYTIDVYRKEFEPERDFFRFATFVALFPQLVAGPIVRAKNFLPQFREDKKFEIERFKEGLVQIAWGFFKKVAIADAIAPFVDQVFVSPQLFTSAHLLVAVFFYSFQIYCDFSGYSNIACGLAQMMGFDFPWNFRTPYFSRNFSEFWTRWHISLSSWLRDYLYISLGGNRKGTFFTYRNLVLTMLLGGLWHGANWTFLFWGFLHGFYLVVQRLTETSWQILMSFLRIPRILQATFAIAIVYFWTCFAWIFFRAPNFSTAWQVIDGIARMDGMTVVNKPLVAKCLFLIFVLLTAEITHQFVDLQKLAVRNTAFRIAAITVLLLFLDMFGVFESASFIYFQF